MAKNRQAHKIDDGESPETGSERLCAVTREVRDPDELIRFALGSGWDSRS